MKRRSARPDKRALRREAIQEALKALDNTITAIEFIEDPGPPDEQGNCWADVWLFRVGTSAPPEEVSVLVNIEGKRVLQMEHPGTEERT